MEAEDKVVIRMMEIEQTLMDRGQCRLREVCDLWGVGILQREKKSSEQGEKRGGRRSPYIKPKPNTEYKPTFSLRGICS